MLEINVRQRRGIRWKRLAPTMVSTPTTAVIAWFPKPRTDVLSIDNETTGFKAKRFDKYRTLPKLPLVRVSLLSLEWYNNSQKLQEKVFSGGDHRKMAVINKEDLIGVAEKKRELGDRLMWQYAEDFVTSKGIPLQI